MDSVLNYQTIIEVLLHTAIDWMRTDEEDEEGRKINHHGKSITVGVKQNTDTGPLVDGVLMLNTINAINTINTINNSTVRCSILLSIPRQASSSHNQSSFGSCF